MIKTLGAILVFVSVYFDLYSYWKQISKTIREKDSKDVSSSAYIMKIGHYLCSVTSLAIFANWVGFGMEFAAFLMCLFTLFLVAKYKPKGWKLFAKPEKRKIGFRYSPIYTIEKTLKSRRRR